MNELLAWLVFPLLGLVACTGVGLLAARLGRRELEPALVPALGFAAAIVVLGPVFATGAGEAWGLAALVVAAVAGYALGGFARLRPGLGAAAGIATYALYIAPVALTGTATFLGYNLLNDTAIHLALVDWIGDHGSRWLAQPPSSYASAIHDYVGSDYPLGSHELLAALRPLVGLDPALVYQPFLALAAALAAGALFALLRRMGLGVLYAALAAVAALASQLVFSFALQGGIKEITFITCLVAAAALGDDPPLMALPAAGLYAIYGIYALPWVIPLAALALALARPDLRAFATGIAVFVVAIAVDIPGSIHYFHHGHDVITRGGELGPLAGPLKPVQAAGIWLTGDYRFTPSADAWITYVLIAVALALALWGLIKRRPLLLIVPPLFATLVTAPFSSPYIDAKLFVVLSPAVVVATCLGIGALPGRRLALAAGVVVGAALLVSDALAYRDALPAPMDRLHELAKIDKRFSGRGPILVNEFEEYVKHFMRSARGSEPYEKWTQAGVQLRRVRYLRMRYADLDEMTLRYVESWPLIALRRSPAASRPPSNYARVFGGRFYEVWRRSGPAPLRHVPLGSTFNAAAVPKCALVRALGARHPLVAPVREPTTVYDIAAASPLPPGWYRDAADPHAIDTAKGGSISVTGESGAPGTVWLRGMSFRRDELLMDGKPVGVARGLQRPNMWLRVGPAQPPAGRHTIELRRPTRSLRPGDGRADQIGPVVVEQGGPPRLIRTQRGHGGALCNRELDWIDVLR